MNSFRTTGILLTVFYMVGVARPAGAYNVASGLRVFPYEGRPGNTLYVSGFGLNPNTKLYILIACPNFQEEKNGNLRIIPPPFGPKTDGAGQFTGWHMQAPKLVGLVSSGCTVYAQDSTTTGGAGYGPTQLGSYYILGPSNPLLPCDRHICVTATPTPKRVKSGRIENVDVQGWAGATADVTVAYPGYPNVVQRKKLDWNGSGRVRVPVPKDMQDTSHVRITVHCQLGPVTGNTKAEFTVVH
jgi:hypothetical protein